MEVGGIKAPILQMRKETHRVKQLASGAPLASNLQPLCKTTFTQAPGTERETQQKTWALKMGRITLKGGGHLYSVDYAKTWLKILEDAKVNEKGIQSAWWVATEKPH